ncbi:MAG: MBL fold metallo-hydrolase [Deltaproteobacteria bacterium]|jgi:N-acyl-phosphatidylethanolamine-hydrolysing phospholipase D
MVFETRNRCDFKGFIKDMRWLILWVVILFVAGACTTQRRVIKNEALDDWDGKRMCYKNLFPSKYGLGEKTAYDEIDFLQPHERRPHTYRLLSTPRGGDIDRTLGYDPSEYTVQPNLNMLQIPTHDVQITWLRHAAFLIQLGGQYQILIDPFLEEFDGAAGIFGKYSEIGTLYAKSPLAAENLPFFGKSENPGSTQTRIVAISHDHLDHLNFKTLKKLTENIHYYVPHGVENGFPAHYTNVTGMDWYTQDRIGDLTLHFLPANHGSGRSLHERNQTLWGGWLFEWNGYRIYFAGDTGYSAVFKDIKRRVGAADICLMPVASWHWRHGHFAPEDAIEAAQDLECRVLIPWGWGTWIIGLEHILEPPRRLQYAWDQIRPQNMELRMLKMGETYGAGEMHSGARVDQDR